MNILQISGGGTKIPPERGGAIALDIFNVSRHMQKNGMINILDRKYSIFDSDIERIGNIKIVRLNARRFDCNYLENLSLGKLAFICRSLLNEISFALATNRYLMKNKDFDLIFIHTPIVGFIITTLNNELIQKSTYISHTNTWAMDVKSLSFYYKAFLLIESFVMRNAKKVVALNDIFMNEFINRGKVSREKISVISNGVDIDLFKPNIKKGDGKFVVLFVGRISKVKGVEYLIRAANIIINKHGNRNITFILVGPSLAFGINTPRKDKYYSQIQEIIEKFQLQEYVQMVEAVGHYELAELYTNCDVFVLPSIAESFGLVVTEAMACGRPVIGTNIPGISSQIIDKYNGFLIEPANEKELADKIKFFVDRPEMIKIMGNRGRKITEERFDWKIIAERLIDNYKEINI